MCIKPVNLYINYDFGMCLYSTGYGRFGSYLDLSAHTISKISQNTSNCQFITTRSMFVCVGFNT